MGGELETPNLDKNPIEGNNNIIKYGLNRVQAWKKSLDVFNINNTLNISEDKKIYIFGLFDGHSGNTISQYLSENFCNELSKNENFISQKYQDSLKETFINMDKSLRKEEINNIVMNYSQKNKDKIREKLTQDKNGDLNEDDINNINCFMNILDPDNYENVLISDYEGCSGLIILIDENITYIANAGNSHFIIINKQFGINNKIIEKQKKQEEQEKKRIKIVKGIKYGKNIKSEEYDYTRGFGDYQYKVNNSINIDSQEIESEPFVYEINNTDIKYIIAFNNGFYENYKQMNSTDKEYKKNYKKIADYFVEQLKDGKKSISDIISDYFDKNIITKENKENNNQYRNLVPYNISLMIIEFFS